MSGNISYQAPSLNPEPPAKELEELTKNPSDYPTCDHAPHEASSSSSKSSAEIPFHKIAALVSSKEKELEELRENLSDLKLSLETSMEDIENTEARAKLVLSVERITSQERARMHSHVADIEDVQSELQTANAEVVRLTKLVARIRALSRSRVKRFKAEKAKWNIDRRRFQAHIGSLVESLNAAHAPFPNRDGVVDTMSVEPSSQTILSHTRRSHSESSGLVAVKIKKREKIKARIRGMTIKNEEFPGAFSAVLKRKEELRRRTEKMIEKLEENPKVKWEASLQQEFLNSSKKNLSSSCPFQSQVELPDLKRETNRSIDTQIEGIIHTNQCLTYCSEQLPEQVIGQPSFEQALNPGFQRFRDTTSQCQGYELSSTRQRSSFTTAKTLNPVKTKKANVLKKLNESAAQGAQAVVRSLTKGTKLHQTPHTHTHK